MAELNEVLEALRRADAAGNTEDARKLAAIADNLRRGQAEGPKEFSVADYAQSFAGGVNRGLANIAGLPVDIANLALSQVGLGSDRPVGGSRQLREDVFESTETGRGMIAPGATDRLGRVLQRTGEEVGASALPAGAILGTAARAAQPAKGVFGAFINPIRQAPGRAALGETVAATGAGLGAGIAQEAAPGSQIAETGGQVVGGVTPALLANTPAALATRAAAGVVSRLPQAQVRRGQEAVSDLLSEELTDRAVEGLREADRLRESIPGFDPSLGEATGSPPLLAQQRRVESQASGPTLDRLVDRRVGSEQAVERHLEAIAPGADGSPAFIIDSANQSLDEIRGVAREATDQLQRQREVIAEGLPTTDRRASGEALRTRLNELRSDARTALSQRATELGIDEVDLTVPFGRFREELTSEFAPRSVFEDTASQPEILAMLREMDALDSVSFNDVKALRERISDDLIDSLGASNPNRRRVRTLTLMKERLDDFVNSLDGEFGELAETWRTFRLDYFENFINRFERGVAFKVRQKDGRAFYRTPDEKVAQTFFSPRDVTAAQQYKRAFGDDPEALAAMEATALDSLRDFAVRNGVVEPLRLETWLRNHRSVLDEFPTIRQAVADVEVSNNSVVARQQQLTARQRQIDDQILSRELASFARGTRTPEQILSGDIRDPRRMQQLKTLLSDKPEALAALQRNIWRAVGQQDAAGIYRTLLDNEESLKILFSNQHLKDMQDIALARAMLERTTTPTGTAYVPRPLGALERLIGRPLPQIASRLFAFQTGRVQPGYLAVDTALTSMRNRAQTSADELLSVVLYDADVAKSLAGAVRSGKFGPEKAKRLQARLFALGVPFVEDQQNGSQ